MGSLGEGLPQFVQMLFRVALLPVGFVFGPTSQTAAVCAAMC